MILEGGNAVPVAFAVCLVLIAGLSESLQQGVFGPGAVEIPAMGYGALALGAAFILRSDVIAIFSRSGHRLGDHARRGRSWRCTKTGLVPAPLLCLVPLGFAVSSGRTPAPIAAGTGLWLLAPRLFGTSILAVAAVHAALVVILDRVIPLDPGSPEIRASAICFTVGAAILSFTVLALTTRDGKELRNA